MTANVLPIVDVSAASDATNKLAHMTTTKSWLLGCFCCLLLPAAVAVAAELTAMRT